MRYRDHLVRTEEPDPTEGWPSRTKMTMWCGDVNYTMVGATKAPVNMGCVKCAKAYWAAELKASPHKLELVVSERTFGLRSLYVAHFNGEPAAYVGIDAGWKKAWQVWPLERRINHTTPDNGMPALVKGDKAVRAGLKGKEAALAAIPELHEKGLLPSDAELQARVVAAWPDIFRRRAQHRLAVKETVERNRLINEAVVALLARDDLTNMERAGLVALCEEHHISMVALTEGEDA